LLCSFLFVPLFVALALICVSKAVEVSFEQNYKVTWGKNHVFFMDNGREVHLSFDKISGLNIEFDHIYKNIFLVILEK